MIFNNFIKKIIILGLLFSPFWGYAITETTTGGNVFSSINPRNPGSFETVTVKLTSFSIDLDRANISWELNGEVLAENIGQTNFSFQTGAVGKEMILRINIIGNNEQFVQKTITINPAEVDILWEAETYVPPFYRGKALPTPGSTIKIVAFPNMIVQNQKIPSSELFFRWQENFANTKQEYGKPWMITTASNLFGEKEISVEISDLNKTAVAKNLFNLNSISPTVLFYEKHPLEKYRFTKSIPESFSLLAQEITLRAEPFFFDLNAVDKINYEWGINDTISTTFADEKEIVLRKNNGSKGEASVFVTVSTPSSGQFAFQQTVIKFGRTNF